MEVVRGGRNRLHIHYTFQIYNSLLCGCSGSSGGSRSCGGGGGCSRSGNNLGALFFLLLRSSFFALISSLVCVFLGVFGSLLSILLGILGLLLCLLLGLVSLLLGLFGSLLTLLLGFFLALLRVSLGVSDHFLELFLFGLKLLVLCLLLGLRFFAALSGLRLLVLLSGSFLGFSGNLLGICLVLSLLLFFLFLSFNLDLLGFGLLLVLLLLSLKLGIGRSLGCILSGLVSLGSLRLSIKLGSGSSSLLLGLGRIALKLNRVSGILGLGLCRSLGSLGSSLLSVCSVLGSDLVLNELGLVGGSGSLLSLSSLLQAIGLLCLNFLHLSLVSTLLLLELLTDLLSPLVKIVFLLGSSLKTVGNILFSIFLDPVALLVNHSHLFGTGSLGIITLLLGSLLGHLLLKLLLLLGGALSGVLGVEGLAGLLSLAKLGSSRDLRRSSGAGGLHLSESLLDKILVLLGLSLLLSEGGSGSLCSAFLVALVIFLVFV